MIVNTMKKKLLLLWSLFTIAIIAWCGANSTNTDQWPTAEDTLAACLTEQWVTMYGTERCPHCRDQKKLFGKNAFDAVRYVDCDKQRTQCQVAGVQWFPTRITQSGDKYPGTQELSELATIAWCEYEE